MQKNMQNNFRLKAMANLLLLFSIVIWKTSCCSGELESLSGSILPSGGWVLFFYSPSDKFKFVPRPISLAGGIDGSRHTGVLTAGCFDHMSWTRKRSLSAQGSDVLVQLTLSFTPPFAPYDTPKTTGHPFECSGILQLKS